MAEANVSKDLGDLSLGRSVVEQMVADGLDGPTISKLELYAFYYWVMGEAEADAIMAETLGEAIAGPKSLSPLLTSPLAASAPSPAT